MHLHLPPITSSKSRWIWLHPEHWCIQSQPNLKITSKPIPSRRFENSFKLHFSMSYKFSKEFTRILQTIANGNEVILWVSTGWVLNRESLRNIKSNWLYYFKLGRMTILWMTIILGDEKCLSWLLHLLHLSIRLRLRLGTSKTLVRSLT